jgi:hypothetical protein
MADLPSRLRPATREATPTENTPVDQEEQKRRLLEQKEKERQLEIVKYVTDILNNLKLSPRI